MNEYIFEIVEALYNEETKESVLRPKYKGKLIRCKECEHYCNGGCMKTEGMITPEPYGFCSWAERKDDVTLN